MVPPPKTAPAVTSLTAAPHVTLVALSDWQGVIKPCGCTEELQRGGVERIGAWLKKLRSKDDSVVLVHAGAVLAEDEPAHAGQEAQRLQRAATFSKILTLLDVAAVALSSADVARDGIAKLLGAGRWPLLGAGYDGGIKRTIAHRIVTTGSGLKVGIFAIDPKAGDLARYKAIAADQLKALRGQGAQVVVLLSNLSMRNSRRVARAVPGIDAVVLGRVPPKTEPVEEGEQDGGAWMLMAPRHGAYMATLTLTVRGDGPWQDASAWLPGAVTRLNARISGLKADLKRYRKDSSVATRRALPFFERQLRELVRARKRAQQAHGQPLPKGRVGGYASVGLAWSEPTDPAVQAMVKAYDAKVGAMNLKIAAKPLPGEPGKAVYVGEAVCTSCHADAGKWAAHDKHHHAWETLIKAGKTKDLDCVPCHVTGWQKPGGSAFDNLDRFARVQCEACHGPGSLHLSAPKKSGPDSHINRRPPASVCNQCHTPEHAPRFSYRDYAPRLRAPGHGMPAMKKKK
ncbi:MAG: hypothetical protein KC502_11900 [Myxococcales bacterium]|nr:hypothetical protein [Myxococcales bacterium]